MSCTRENCQICADSKAIREFKALLPNVEMRTTFDAFMDRMLGAEEEEQIQSIYAQGYQHLLVWYIALDSFEAVEVEDAYESIKFLQDWRDDIRENIWSAMNAHVWGPT